jgi:hypothetical protein
MLDWEVKTISRFAPKKAQKRKENDRSLVPIRGNTDFEQIADGAQFFACGDLPTLQSKGEYKNSNPKYGEFYKSALTIPIRCVTHEERAEDDDVYDIIGFLCLDSDSVCPDWERDDNYVYGFTALLADSLYILLRENMEYITNIQQSQTNGKIGDA